MKLRKRFLIYSAAFVGVICILIPTTLFFINTPVIENGIEEHYMYPNILFNRGTRVDIELEGNYKVHFLIKSYNQSYNNPAFITINYSEKNSSYRAMLPTAWVGTIHQLRIGLTPNPNHKFISYLFCTDPFFSLGAKLYTSSSEGWILYSPLEDWNNPYSSFYKRGVLDWFFMPSGEIVLAFVYEDGISNTPAIYNETTDSFYLLRDDFSEIQGFETIYNHGDFHVADNNIFLLWERLLQEDKYHPFLAIKWGNNSWKLTQIGSENDTLTPIAIFSQDDKTDVFYYDTGVYNDQSKLCLLEIYNSTVNSTRVIHQFDGRVFFDNESLKKVSANEYVMFYDKSSFVPYSQSDLYMGYLNNQTFTETRLTDTPDEVEIRAVCEVDEEFVHYSWVTSEYTGTSTFDPYKAKIYYNRTRISEINSTYIKKDLHFTEGFATDLNHLGVKEYILFYNFRELITLSRRVILLC